MDWLQFFDEHAIEYQQKGPNVAAGNVNVRCPLCVDDPSFHMGVNLSGKGWGCWRDARHRGKSEARLIQLLLRCSFEHASQLADGKTTIPENFIERVNASLRTNTKANVTLSQLVSKVPAEFKSFGSQLPSSRPFMNYMQKRGYSEIRTLSLAKKYDLRYCTSGAYAGRVIFLVYANGKLVSWTGRSIHSTAMIRYKTLSQDAQKAGSEGFAPAHGPIGNYLLWYDTLMKTQARTLVLCEGPFDALRVMDLGRKRGVVATCCFTASPSASQIEYLHEVAPKFDNCLLLLDQGTFATSMRLVSVLASLNFKPLTLPRHIKDPGDLSRHDFAKLFVDYAA